MEEHNDHQRKVQCLSIPRYSCLSEQDCFAGSRGGDKCNCKLVHKQGQQEFLISSHLKSLFLEHLVLILIISHSLIFLFFFFFTAYLSFAQLVQVVCAFLWPPYVGNLNSAGRFSQGCTSCCSVWMELLELCQERLLCTHPSGFVSVCFPDLVIFLIALMIRENSYMHTSKRQFI